MGIRAGLFFVALSAFAKILAGLAFSARRRNLRLEGSDILVVPLEVRERLGI